MVRAGDSVLPAFFPSSLQQSLGGRLPTEDGGEGDAVREGPLGRHRWDPRTEGVGRVGGDFQAPREEGGMDVGAGGVRGPRRSLGGGAIAGVGADRKWWGRGPGLRAAGDRAKNSV